MSRRPRQNHSPAFKAKVALAALKGKKARAEFATSFQETLFLSLVHARVEIAAWVEGYKRERPHSYQVALRLTHIADWLRRTSFPEPPKVWIFGVIHWRR